MHIRTIEPNDITRPSFPAAPPPVRQLAMPSRTNLPRDL